MASNKRSKTAGARSTANAMGGWGGPFFRSGVTELCRSQVNPAENRTHWCRRLAYIFRRCKPHSIRSPPELPRGPREFPTIDPTFVTSWPGTTPHPTTTPGSTKLWGFSTGGCFAFLKSSTTSPSAKPSTSELKELSPPQKLEHLPAPTVASVHEQSRPLRCPLSVLGLSR